MKKTTVKIILFTILSMLFYGASAQTIVYYEDFESNTGSNGFTRKIVSIGGHTSEREIIKKIADIPDSEDSNNLFDPANRPANRIPNGDTRAQFAISTKATDNNTNYGVDAYAVFTTLDLTSANALISASDTHKYATFWTQRRWGNGDIATVTIVVTTAYTGDPSTTSWTVLPLYSGKLGDTSDGRKYVQGTVDLTSYANGQGGTTVTLALHYQGSSSAHSNSNQNGIFYFSDLQFIANSGASISQIDTEAPVITLNVPNLQIIELGTAYTELGATATDNVDSDISANIVIDATAVDINSLGDYSVTYNVSDVAGNSAVEVIRTVRIIVPADTEPPIITLNVPNLQIIELGTVYTELGATATDNVDGDISANIVIDISAVDITSLGDYSVTYNVSDAAGNPAIEVIRTVTVTSSADTEVPVITLIGANPQFIELGNVYTELGATATDNVDGDISANIVIDISAVDINSLGDYSVTYNVSDAAGNPAIEVIRTVTVTSSADTEVPVITLIGANPQFIELGNVYTELGATATDNVDGDISANIVIDISAVDINSLGDYSVTYNVSDAAGNPAIQKTRTVRVTSPADIEAPVITLNGISPQIIELGTAYTELGATATDNVDGDITANIIIDATAVDINSVGDYSVTYNVSDAAGNPAIEVIRTVTVTSSADIEAPVITLIGANPQFIELGTAYTELGATATDNVDGDISANIVIDISAVDITSLGDYSVTYNVSDVAGNQAIEVIRTVTVTSPADTEAPVITLNGISPQIIELGTAYTELGATATDNVDGDISANIVIDISAVDITSLGDYSVTYNVSDAAGNPAIEVIRTVRVTSPADTEAPVITLNGISPQIIELGTAYTELGATATDNVDSDISANIVIDATAVDINSLGDYSVTYNVSDAAGNPAIEVIRTVTITISAPTTPIPDDNFEDALIALGIDTNGKNNTILNSDAVAVNSLDVSSKSIASLTGIEAFISLISLNCDFNSLTSLDVSKNVALTELLCNRNQLTSLNAKNGNNNSLVTFNTTGNPRLTCIQVDDASSIPSSWEKDDTATYSDNCDTAGNEDFERAKIFISPNPTTGIINIYVDEKVDYKLLNIRGQVLIEGTLETTEKKIDISSLSKGIYLLNLKTSKSNLTEKVVRN